MATFTRPVAVIMVAVIGFTAALVAGPAAAEKYALLCGCAVYDKGPNPKPADLKTTIADVLSLYELLLNRFGFKAENVRVLLSPPELWPLTPAPAGPATTANIAESFASWFSRAGPDDLIFFSYSGHGTFLHYTGGGAEVHEEALLGSDYAALDLPQVLTFSQLRWLHSRLHDGQSVFVIDACHSGGGSLALNALVSPFGPEPPLRYTSALEGTRPVETPALAAAGIAPQISAEDLDKIQRRSLTVTACQSWEAASASGPQLRLLDKLQETGVLTGNLVKATAAGPANESWEDIGRTARFLVALSCIGQTVGVHGQGQAAMPFTQPAAPPNGPPYYAATAAGESLMMPADPFLGPGSALAVYKDSPPAGAPVEPAARLGEAPAPDSDVARLIGNVPPEGLKAAVVRTQHMALPQIGVFAQAADALGRDQPEESKSLREQLAPLPYAHQYDKASDPGVDYRLWVSLEDEDKTRPFARARSAQFPSPQVQGQPKARSLVDSTRWLTGMLHYVRAVQGAAWARNHGGTFRVSVTPDLERPLYLPDAPATLTLEATVPCSIVVLVADSAGNLIVLGPQAVAPDQPARVVFRLPASSQPHDMRLAVIKAFAFSRAPDQAAVAQAMEAAKTDPAAAMLGLLAAAVGGASVNDIPADGWADNEAFATVWDRTPLAGPLEF